MSGVMSWGSLILPPIPASLSVSSDYLQPRSRLRPCPCEACTLRLSLSAQTDPALLSFFGCKNHPTLSDVRPSLGKLSPLEPKVLPPYSEDTRMYVVR